MDYAGVNVVLALTVEPEQRREVFEGLQTMERAAMAVMNKRAKK